MKPALLVLAAGWVLGVAAAGWLVLVSILRPRAHRRAPSPLHPARRFPTAAPVSLRDLHDGRRLDAMEDWAWRGIVADLRDWQKDGA